MTDQWAVKLVDIEKSFHDYPVLRGINFNVPKGSITSILGFSGSGKSTIIKHILGLLKPDKGEVIVMGKNINQLDDFALREFRKNFGMLFQYAALFDSLTTFENVAFPIREFSLMDEASLTKKVEFLLSEVDLTKESFHRLPSELSGGMRKRVGLARALALDPQIILYDEPTTGLDPITTKKVNDLIVRTALAGKHRHLTSIIISHDIKATLQISDFVAFLGRGKIIEYLPVEEFVRSKNPVVREFLDI